MDFNEIRVGSTIADTILIQGDFDEVILSAHEVVRQMGNKMMEGIIDTISKAAEESGNVYHVKALDAEAICQILEKADLTFNDEGVMDHGFIIPPQVSDEFKKLVADARVQAIIERKRREYFAKKGN